MSNFLKLHKSKVEWIYITGEINSGGHNGNLFWVLFKIDLGPVRFFLLNSRISLFGSDQIKNSIFPFYSQKNGQVKLSGVHLFEDFGSILLKDKRLGIDMVFIPVKPLIKYSFDGKIKMGNFGESYYQSYTDVFGKGSINGKFVEGRFWIDRQWGNWNPSKDKWNWFGIQLNNGCELMIFDFISGKSFAALIDKNSKVSLTQNVSVISKDYFSSSGSKKGIKLFFDVTSSFNRNYPSLFQIDLVFGRRRINLDIVVDKRAQEIKTLDHYFEGVGSVLGNFGESSVSGTAFVEVVGYDR